MKHHLVGALLFLYDNLIRHGEVPKRLKGLPWKGSRSLIAARGFKSLLLRNSFYEFEKTFKVRKRLLTTLIRCDKIVELVQDTGKICEKKLSKRPVITGMNLDN